MEEQENEKNYIRAGKGKSKETREIDILLLNVNRAAATWDVVDSMLADKEEEEEEEEGTKRPEVVCLEDVRLEEEQWHANRKRAKRNGYTAYYQEGYREQGERENMRGGTMVLVDKRCPQKLMSRKRCLTKNR